MDVVIPDVADIAGFEVPVVIGFVPRQAYHFVIFGEKASLEDVLLPIAEQRQADLYLPTGEISDTLVYRIAKDADEDGRPLVLFTLADCDPAGRQMPVSIGRKLKALRDLLFPDLQFEVVPIELTATSSALGLPSTPLKETERRADRWREAFGIEQSEIDALATLRPDVLSEIVEDAFDPYLDRDLDRRVQEAEDEWQELADAMLRDQIDLEQLEASKAEAGARLTELEGLIVDINARLRMLATEPFTLPVIDVPEPEFSLGTPRQALVYIGQEWIDATRALIARKAYGGDTP